MEREKGVSNQLLTLKLFSVLFFFGLFLLIFGYFILFEWLWNGQTPGKKISGLRDILAHHYFEVDLDIVWDIVQNKLPELERDLNKKPK